MSAELGDDVYGEDPTVNRLEKYCAVLLGKEAAIFAPSGTQSNLLALLSHCERGDEYIVGQDAHTYKYEGGGAAVLGSIQPQPIEFESPGIMPPEKIKAAIKPDDSHFAKTRLVCLENTQHGVCLDLNYPSKIKAICEQHQLKFHLDGARLFNAQVAQKKSLVELTECFDSVSLCLSKGLGAPAGSVLVGDEQLISKARRWRKVLGGGMRQSGILAAAGLYALKNNIERLDDDHRRAKKLAEALVALEPLTVHQHSAHTNMVFVDVPVDSLDRLHAEAEKYDIRLPMGNQLRLVTHLDIDDAALEMTIEMFNRVYSK